MKNIANNAIDRAMGKRTVAGCVENAGSFRVLSDLSVDLAQGCHLGQPQRKITPEKG